MVNTDGDHYLTADQMRSHVVDIHVIPEKSLNQNDQPLTKMLLRFSRHVTGWPVYQLSHWINKRTDDYALY